MKMTTTGQGGGPGDEETSSSQWVSEPAEPDPAVKVATTLGDAGWGQDVINDVTVYVAAVTSVLSQAKGNVPEQVLMLRRRRDRRVDLHLLQRDPAGGVAIRSSLGEYDALVDGLIATSAETEKGVDATALADIHELFTARVTRMAQQQRSMVGMWSGGVLLGLAALVMTVWSALQFDPRAWSWPMISVGGVGALLAAFYILKAASTHSPLRRFGLAALPLGIFGVVVVLLVEDGRLPVAAAVVALAAALVLVPTFFWPDHETRHEGRARRSSGVLSLMGVTTTSSSTTTWRHLLVADELENLRRRIQQEARAQRRASLAWATTFIVVGGLAALLSGAAGVTANQTDATDWVAALAIGGAGLTALMTAVNPGRRWEQARTLQLACESLEQEVGVLIRLDLEPSADPKAGRQRIEDIAIMYDSLLGLPDRPRIPRT